MKVRLQHGLWRMDCRKYHRALNPDLDRIVKNARESVEKEFTYEATLGRYRKILENI